MITSDQPAAANKKYLDHRILLLSRKRNNIPIFSSCICNLLFLGNLSDTSDQFPVFDCFLKFQIIRCLHHLLFQISQYLLIVSIQELQHLIYRLFVFFLRNIPLTWSIALLDMVVKARPLLSDILGKASVAASQMIQLPYQFNRILHCSHTRIRTKIFSLIFLHLTGHHNSRVCLIYRNFDKRIAFVIHQHGIVFRAVFLDQITFQH